MRFQCICTPGHTRGHMCLYRERDKTLFTGDHVLFDISPNIMAWPQKPGALASYLKSLEKIRAFEVKLALPAHRNPGDSLKGRADELIAHHLARLEEVEAILAENTGISGYEVASRMKWSIRAAGWESFPSSQKWFAVGEALAHLEFLQMAGRIERTPQGKYQKV